MSIRILQGDCREVMASLDAGCVDAVVTDPPYELGFMGKGWDSTGIANSVEMWREALRVLKPGGHLLAFSGTRTYHRMACAIEDAGFDVRDQMAWVYGSGFPKSRNGEWGGTALKPAWEPICMARKPLIGTVEANWLAHGTGALNIDGCRVPSADPALGRWPANIIHDGSDEVLAAFPRAPGQLADASSSSSSRKTQNVYGAMRRGRGDDPIAESENDGVVGFKMRPGARRFDEGSASRFFYCAKATTADRNAGLADLPLRASGMVSNTSGQHITRRDGGAPPPRANHHPTVKPTELMRYLVRLVTPRGGIVLDPFLGSGSTLKAAELEGLSGIGIELSPEYIEIARRRIVADSPLLSEVHVA